MFVSYVVINMTPSNQTIGMKYLSIILHVITLIALGFTFYFWHNSNKLIIKQAIDLQSFENEKNEQQEDLNAQIKRNGILRKTLIQNENNEEKVALNLNKVNSQVVNALRTVGESSQLIAQLKSKIVILEEKHTKLKEQQSKILDTKKSEQLILRSQIKKHQDTLGLQNLVMEARNRELEKQVQTLEIELARIKYLSKSPLKVENPEQLKQHNRHRIGGTNSLRANSLSLRK